MAYPANFDKATRNNAIAKMTELHNKMREAAAKVPYPTGVSMKSTRNQAAGIVAESETQDLERQLGGLTPESLNFSFPIAQIEARMKTLTINKYIAQAGPYPGLSVAWGDEPLYDPNFDENITRATADAYIGLSVAANWAPYYQLYDENGIYMIRTGAGLDTPPAPLAIGLPMVIQVLGQAIDSLAPFFKTAPGDNYVIRGNMMVYYLQNTLVNPNNGDLYDFPNLVIWFLNPNGRISFEMDIYDLISAGYIVNSFYNDYYGLGPNSGVGRSGTLLPIPAAPGSGPLPTLKTLDDFQKDVVTRQHRMRQRAKYFGPVVKGNDKLFSTAYHEFEVRAAFSAAILQGYLIPRVPSFYLQFKSDMLYLPNDLEFVQGKSAFIQAQNGVLASMPGVKINRIDFVLFKGNQVTFLVWFDMVGASGTLYCAPKVIQLYYSGLGQFDVQEDFIDQLTFIRQTAAYLADV